MHDTIEPGAALREGEIARLFAALAGADPRQAVLQAVEAIAMARMHVTLFSAAICFLDTLELERIYSSRPQAYAVGGRKSKRETRWAQQVMIERRVFVGEGPLEMAAAFDDQERMASEGIRSIINVPIVVRDRCIGVLNFGRGEERVGPADVLLARLLGLTTTAVFAAGAGAAGTATALPGKAVAPTVVRRAAEPAQSGAERRVS